MFSPQVNLSNLFLNPISSNNSDMAAQSHFQQCRLQSTPLTLHNFTRTPIGRRQPKTQNTLSNRVTRVSLVRNSSGAARFPTAEAEAPRVCSLTGRPDPGLTVLVTGASGYLGGRLCHELLNQGYSVKAFVRKTSDISSLPPPTAGGGGGSLQIVYGDVTDYPSLLEAVSSCHVIFHTAALVDLGITDPEKFSSVNVGGLKNVLKAYKETSTIEKIIYTSSFFALGPTDGDVGDENQVHPGKFFCTEYEKSKAIADKIALDAAAEGVPVVPVYPGVIYGPGKVTTGNSLALLLVERFSGRIPGYFGQEKGFSFCHVDDVVQGHIAAMTKGRAGERYLLTGENASFKDVFDIAAEITRTEKPRFGIPHFVIESCGWLLFFFTRITGTRPLFSPPALNILKHQWAYSCAKAKKELDYNPRNLKEGLTEMLPWLKSLGLITY